MSKLGKGEIEMADRVGGSDPVIQIRVASNDHKHRLLYRDCSGGLILEQDHAHSMLIVRKY